ncbi:unnamed protein product [Cochlearia groenlandica]
MHDRKMDKSTALSSVFVGDDNPNNNNTLTTTPLMVTPLLPPVITTPDDDVDNTELAPRVMVRPRQAPTRVTTFAELMKVTKKQTYNNNNNNNVSSLASSLMVTPAHKIGDVISLEDLMRLTDSPPPPYLMVTPAEPVAPVIASEDGVMVTEETHNTEPFAPLVVTPAEPVAPVIASEDGVMVTEEPRNTEQLAPLVVTPAEPVAPVFTESEDDVMMINEETHNLESLPFALVTPLAKATLVTGSDDDVMMITEETDHNTEPLAPAMVTVPDKPLAAVTAPDDDDDDDDDDVMIIESLPAPTVTPPPAAATDTTLHNVMITMVDRFSFESHSGSLMVTPLRTAPPPPPPQVMVTSLAMVPYGYNFNNDNAAAEAGPSTGPIKRGRGRPIGSKNKISKTATKKRKTPETDGEIAKPSPKLGRPKGAKNKKPKTATKEEKTTDPERRLIRSCPSHFDSGITQEELRDGFQEVVDSVLMKADAVRRRLYQVNSKWAINAVITNCINLGVKTNQTRRIGPVPGVHVGDIFYACGEMSLVGLHLAQMAGIDKFKAEDNSSEGLVATSVVSNSRYNDDMSDFNALIYTGHGGKGKDGKPCDQILRSGNKAMAESKTKGNDVRVIIGEEVGKKETIYVYDGLYTVIDHWEDLVLKKVGTESKEFKEFKFKLVRKPNQLPGYSTWKAIEQWRKEGSESSREGFVLGDLSGGEEALPVTVVNDLDVTDKQLPIDFKYTRSLIYTGFASATNPPIDPETALTATGCAESCRGRTCFTENADCVCVRKNGNELPYYNQFLVCRKPTVFECGDLCHCVSNCKNRVVQMGVKLRLEVFKTESRGWGLRSWDPIRAGTFICEFAGKNKTEQEIQEDDDDDDEYLFDSSRVFESFQWNYEPELTMESGSERVCEEFELKSRILISGKSHGNVGRFMNHSCWANVMWQPVECEQNGEFYYRVGLFAKKHIPPLKELTYDYGVSGVKGKKVCLCGSYNCRGFFG